MTEARTYAPHDCTEFVTWHNTDTYNMITCSTCKKILKFRFKSFWKRIDMLLWGGVYD